MFENMLRRVVVEGTTIIVVIVLILLALLWIELHSFFYSGWKK